MEFLEELLTRFTNVADTIENLALNPNATSSQVVKVLQGEKEELECLTNDFRIYFDGIKHGTKVP